MRAFFGFCALLLACGPSPALEPVVPPQTPAQGAPTSPASLPPPRPCLSEPGGCPPARPEEPAPLLEENATIEVTRGETTERVEIELNRELDRCKIEASAGGTRREVATKGAECEAIFQKFRSLDGAWGSGGLGCEGCAKFSLKHSWVSTNIQTKPIHQRGAKAAFFPRRLDEQDQATGLYAEAGRLGRLAGASLTLLP